MSSHLLGLAVGLLVPLCFGSGMVLARIGLVHVPARTGNFLSLLAGWIVVTMIAAIFFTDQVLAVSLGGLAWFCLMGVVNFPLGRFMNFVSVKQLGILRANPVLSASPIVSAFEGIVFLGEDTNVAIAIGTLFTVAGVITVVTAEVRSRQTSGFGKQDNQQNRGSLFSRKNPLIMGYLAALTGAIAYGTVPALGKIAVNDYSTPIVTASYTMLFGWLAMGLFVATSLPRDMRSTAIRPNLLLAASGVLMAIGIVALYTSLTMAPVVVVSPVFSLNAVISLILVHTFLQRLERITLPLVIGTLLVVGGVASVAIGAA